MKILKSLMLGTTVGLVAITGAHSADLAVKAEAVKYVQTCSLYGAGFYYIPGTDICIRIGATMRIDTAFNGNAYDVPFWQGGMGGAGHYNRDFYTTKDRFNLFIDTRTATEYGVLRTYANLQFDWTHGRENISGGYVAVDYAFIQFAGFTFGKAVSQFDPQWALAKPYISSGFLAGSNDATGIPQLAYTASFGSGVSATISLEDAQPYRSAGVINTSVPFLGPFGAATTGYGTSVNTFTGNVETGDHVPDILGNIRVDQAWGSLHFGAAAHEVHGTYYTAANSDLGHPESTWGYAVTGAFDLKNLPTGVGDSLKVEATFANGAAKYVWGGTVDVIGGGRFAVANAGTMGFGYVLDGVYGGLGTAAAPGTRISKSTAWDVSAYYEHYWTSQWRTSVFGSYSQIDYGSGGNALLMAAATGGLLSTGVFAPAAGTTGGGFKLAATQFGTRTAWTPVRNLTLSAEFIYSHIGQHLDGTFTSAAVPGYSLTAFTMKDQNLYNGAVQILRSF